MIAVHVTNRENACKIITSSNIEPHGISIDDLFEAYIDRLLQYLEHGALDKFLARLDEKHLFPEPKYLYLGRGVYFFREEDFSYAQDYGSDSVPGPVGYVKLELSKSHSNCDLNISEELKKIKEFIETKYLKKYRLQHPNIDEKTLVVLNIIVEIVLYQLDLIDSEKFQPFVLGVALDLYRENTNDKKDVYYYKFYSRQAPYGVIKNCSVVERLEYLIDEREVM